jgi:hypothetical protein
MIAHESALPVRGFAECFGHITFAGNDSACVDLRVAAYEPLAHTRPRTHASLGIKCLSGTPAPVVRLKHQTMEMM